MSKELSKVQIAFSVAKLVVACRIAANSPNATREDRLTALFGAVIGTLEVADETFDTMSTRDQDVILGIGRLLRRELTREGLFSAEALTALLDWVGAGCPPHTNEAPRKAVLDNIAQEEAQRGTASQ